MPTMLASLPVLWQVCRESEKVADGGAARSLPPFLSPSPSACAQTEQGAADDFFTHVDQDGDGSIDLAEFTSAVRSVGSPVVDEAGGGADARDCDGGGEQVCARELLQAHGRLLGRLVGRPDSMHDNTRAAGS
jgi:hypothetical protein